MKLRGASTWQRRFAFALPILAVIAAGAWLVAARHEPEPVHGPDYAALLKAWQDHSGIDRPTVGTVTRPLTLPDDHGFHSGAAAEQWDLAMLLESTDRSERYVLRARFDRLGASAPRRTSRWAAGGVVRRRLTLGLIGRDSLRTHEHFDRVALGLSGFESSPPALWTLSDRLEWAGGDSGRLNVSGRGTRADLRFSAISAASELDDSGALGGQWRAYLIPALRVEGMLGDGERDVAVSGRGWFGHGWGAVPPVGGQLYFNHWILQLSDDSALAIVQWRRRDGSGRPSYDAVVIDMSGHAVSRDASDLELQADGSLSGPPPHWRLRWPGERMELDIRAVIEQSTRNVAGSADIAVRVDGTRDAKALTGWGFMELDGY
ncbi:MAG: lipocalin family protein [Methylotetracoccus sp.]